MSIRIFANHAHVFPASINPDGTIDRLLRLLDSCSIQQAVCFAPFPTQADKSGIHPNRWLAGELRHHDRLRGFGTVDLRRDDVKDQVREIADLGFRGIKLHPNTQRFDILDRRAIEIYAAAEELKLFITFHSGVHQ